LPNISCFSSEVKINEKFLEPDASIQIVKESIIAKKNFLKNGAVVIKIWDTRFEINFCLIAENVGIIAG